MEHGVFVVGLAGAGVAGNERVGVDQIDDDHFSARVPELPRLAVGVRTRILVREHLEPGRRGHQHANEDEHRQSFRWGGDRQQPLRQENL